MNTMRFLQKPLRYTAGVFLLLSLVLPGLYLNDWRLVGLGRVPFGGISRDVQRLDLIDEGNETSGRRYEVTEGSSLGTYFPLLNSKGCPKLEAHTLRITPPAEGTYQYVQENVVWVMSAHIDYRFEDEDQVTVRLFGLSYIVTKTSRPVTLYCQVWDSERRLVEIVATTPTVIGDYGIKYAAGICTIYICVCVCVSVCVCVCVCV